ncbi:hypothetical protein N431DRAFT_430989 [Stipitochalara longipes BDJ]|nr:hypothetical protein N431DRAFT_430989 [Stipitochalara longipes BDJ]
MERLKNLLSTPSELDIPAQPTVLDSFTPFPRLSPEIRDMIWEQATFEPRTIKLFRLDGQLDPEKTSYVEGQLKHPGIVHACRESRRVASEVYEKCQEESRGCGMRPSIIGKRNTVFVNFAIDRFLFVVSGGAQLAHNEAFPDFNFMQTTVRKIQHLEMEVPSSAPDGLCILKLMRVRHITMVHKVAQLASVHFLIVDFPNWKDEFSGLVSIKYPASKEQYERLVKFIILEENDSCPPLEFDWSSTGDDGLGSTGDTGLGLRAPDEESATVIE